MPFTEHIKIGEDIFDRVQLTIQWLLEHVSVYFVYILHKCVVILFSKYHKHYTLNI